MSSASTISKFQEWSLLGTWSGTCGLGLWLSDFLALRTRMWALELNLRREETHRRRGENRVVVAAGGFIHRLMFFWGSLFFHKSILSSHILPLTNRIMMRIIFSNLTEKKNVLAFNFFLSVNEQFQETFLWDKGGGWNYTGNQTKKKGQEKQHYFSGIGFGCTTVRM